jgi:hypothetical protein
VKKLIALLSLFVIAITACSSGATPTPGAFSTITPESTAVPAATLTKTATATATAQVTQTPVPTATTGIPTSAYGVTTGFGPVSCAGKPIVKCGFKEHQGGPFCQNGHLCSSFNDECLYQDPAGLKYCTANVETQCSKRTKQCGKGQMPAPVIETAVPIFSQAQVFANPVEIVPCQGACKTQTIAAGKPVTLVTTFTLPSKDGVNLFAQSVQVYVWIDGTSPFVLMDENHWGPITAKQDPTLGILYSRTWSMTVPAFKAGSHHIKVVFYFAKTTVIDSLGAINQGIYIPTRDADFVAK